jgi:hypothetical protein
MGDDVPKNCSPHFGRGKTVFVRDADRLDRNPFQDRGGEGIEKNVGINPDSAFITGNFGHTEDEAFLPGRASAPRAFAPIKRLLDHEQIEAMPFRVCRPISAAKLLEAIAVGRADC